MNPNQWLSSKWAPVPFQGGQARTKLCDSLSLLPQADQGEASAHGCLCESLRQEMLAREGDGRLGSRSRRGKLALKVMREPGPRQSKGEAVGVRERLGQGGASFDPLQGAIGEAEKPKGPRR
jgi:hypothetical protein